jgi:hypothetical protein
MSLSAHHLLVHATMSFLDTYSYFFFRFVFPFMVFFQFRKLLPRKIVPLVSHSIEDASTLLERSKAINIPNLDVYQDKYESYACL